MFKQQSTTASSVRKFCSIPQLCKEEVEKELQNHGRVIHSLDTDLGFGALWLQVCETCDCHLISWNHTGLQCAPVNHDCTIVILSAFVTLKRQKKHIYK